MTINPVDMQVVLPKTEQVNKIQRGLQHQQQTEQKIQEQLIQKDIRRREQAINEMENLNEKKIKDEEKKKEQQKEHNKREMHENNSGELAENKEEDRDSKQGLRGHRLDIKI